jgi:Beta-xylosidase
MCAAGIWTCASPELPVFRYFSYQGEDGVYESNQLKDNAFYTPILQGCYPDPSIVRKGNDYYLVNSSFVFYPGVPIFHSTDLVNWKQIGHVLDRPTQLKLEGLGMSRGIYAPDISYNPHNDTFYMVTTHVGGGLGNMVVKAKDPAGDWSDPIQLAFDGIDPALFFDEDGRAYLVHNDAPEKAEYEGHRVIKIWEYDVEKDQVIGPGKVIVNGGVDLSQKPIWIEGPHIYKKNGMYYLMCAEGGTADIHSEVIFKSASVMGPYIPAAQNPILTQRHLDPARPNKVEWVGHADLVSTPSGDYYGVFLGIRPNETGRVNTGRETYILPVDWSGAFPVFEGGLEPLQASQPLPEGAINQTGKEGFMPNGNFRFEDDFKAQVFDPRWISIRGPYQDFATLTAQGLEIRSAAQPFEGNTGSPSMLCFRQQHNAFTAETTLRYFPASEADLAGLVCLQNENFNYILGLTKQPDGYCVVLKKTEKGVTSVLASQPVSKLRQGIRLRVSAKGDVYEFGCAEGSADFVPVGEAVSGAVLSTHVAGGFTGCLLGLYATTAN